MPEGDFRLGPSLVQPQLNAILIDDRTVHLEPKVMEVLLFLARHAGEVVQKDALIRNVWGDTFVTDSALTRCIAELRKAFDDDPRESHVIQTIAKSGYRLVAPIEGAVATALPAAGPVARDRWKNISLKVLAYAAVGALGGAIAWNLKTVEPVNPPSLIRFPIDLSGRQFTDLRVPAIAVSPDGTRLVYAAGGKLYLRAIDRLDATIIPGTDGAFTPFFSPDGKWLGFFAEGKLKKVSLSGGPPISLANAIGSGATWGDGDTIVFVMVPRGLARISSAGGVPEIVTRVDYERGEMSHECPDFLPGGRTLLFVIEPASGNESEFQIAVQSLETGERRVLVRGGTAPRYLPTGHLTFMRGGSLLAVPFDSERLEVKGEPVQLLEGVYRGRFVGQLASSRSGSLVYIPGAPKPARRLVWVDRKGTIEPLGLPPQDYEHPALSPDGSRLAVGIRTPAGEDIWTGDPHRGPLTRLTWGGMNFWPIWTREGTRVVFTSAREGPLTLWWKSADGSAPEERLPTGDRSFSASSFSRDGKLLAYSKFSPETLGDIWITPLDGSSEPKPFLRTAYLESGAMFSPDGRYIAYHSMLTGRREVFVRPFLGAGGGPWQVSTEGGREPLWAHSGRELFFRSDDRMLAVGVATDPSFRADKQSVLFRGNFRKGGKPNYAVTPDDKRFLMVEEHESPPPTQINVVLGWFQDVRARTSAR